MSTSPRCTWLWSPDEVTAERVRAVLDESGNSWTVAQRRGQQLPLATDVDIGVAALEACEALASAGFAFAWHETQHPLNRGGWESDLPGMRQDGAMA